MITVRGVHQVAYIFTEGEVNMLIELLCVK